MNYKYVKKVIVIEAYQMTLERRWDDSDWPPWLNEAWQMSAGAGAVWVDPNDPTGTSLICGTLESLVSIDFDDYIIQGVNGEIFSCKPDIFDLTYESLETS